MPKSTRIMQGRSHLGEAVKVVKCRVLGWATSFSTIQCTGLEAGSTFVNLLYQLHECGSEISFAPAWAACTMPKSQEKVVWLSLWADNAPRGI